MFSTALRSAARTALCAATLLGSAGLSGARANAVYDTPITLVDVTFTDGTLVTGTFSLNVYGNLNAAYDVVTQAGAVSAYTYAPGPGAVAPSVSPAGDPTVITFFRAGYQGDLKLVFQHALDIAGPDPIVAAESYECPAYTCPAASDRTVISGFAEVPEPATLALLGAGLVGIAATRRRPD